MDALALPADRLATKGANNGIIFTSSLFSKSLNDLSEKFYMAYLAKYGKEPSHVAAIAYELIYTIVYSIHAGNESPLKLRDSIVNQGRASSLGGIYFSNDRGLVFPMGIWEIHGETPVLVYHQKVK